MPRLEQKHIPAFCNWIEVTIKLQVPTTTMVTLFSIDLWLRSCQVLGWGSNDSGGGFPRDTGTSGWFHDFKDGFFFPIKIFKGHMLGRLGLQQSPHMVGNMDSGYTEPEKKCQSQQGAIPFCLLLWFSQCFVRNMAGILLFTQSLKRRVGSPRGPRCSACGWPYIRYYKYLFSVSSCPRCSQLMVFSKCLNRWLSDFQEKEKGKWATTAPFLLRKP